MEKNENKTDIEQNKLLTLATESDDYKRPLPADEDEDFFPELTKEFDSLKKELNPAQTGFENRFVLSATDFLKNLSLTAFDVLEKRVHSTYNEWINVQNALYKVIYSYHRKDIKTIHDAIDLNKKSAIALQSVIPQLRKIIHVYDLPLTNKNAMKKMTKGSFLLGKIEQIQEIIARFNNETVDSESYMNYEKSLLSAYILTKRIEEGDTLFNVQGFSANIERACKVLESEKDLTPLLTTMLPTISLYSFFEEASYIYAGLNKEASSIHRATAAFINHLSSGRLPKRSIQIAAQEQQNQKLYDMGEQLKRLIEKGFKEMKDEEQKTRDHVSKEHKETIQKLDQIDVKLDNATEDFQKEFEDQLNEHINKTPSSPFHKLLGGKREEAFRFSVAYMKNNYNLSRTVKSLGLSKNYKSHVKNVLEKVDQYKPSPKSGKKHGHKQATRERNLTPQERQKMN